MNNKILYIVLVMTFSSCLASIPQPEVPPSELSQDELNKHCIDAAMNGSLSVMNDLLARGAKVTSCDAGGKTALHWAAATGQLDCVGVLLTAGANVNARDSGGKTPLHWTAANDHSSCMRLIINAGSDLDTRDSNGETALHLAAFKNHDSCVKALNKAKNELNVQLVEAARKGFTQRVIDLVRRGARVDFISEDGSTALYWAAKNGDKILMKLLTEYRAKVASSATSGAAPFDQIVPEKSDTKKTPIALGPDSEAIISKKTAALNEVLEKGNAELLHDLISSGVDVNAQNQKGEPVLCVAAKNGFYGCLILLIQAGADVTARDKSGKTALHWAAMNDHSECIPPLVGAGAQINARDAERNTPFGMAARNRLCVKALYKAKHQLDLRFIDAAQKGASPHVLTAFIEQGASIFACDMSGRSPLHHVSARGDIESIKVLVKAGAVIDAWDKSGDTALMYAASKGRADSVKALIELKADVNIVNALGYSALMLAAAEGADECVQALVDADANVRIQSRAIETALTLAEKNGHEESIRILAQAALK